MSELPVGWAEAPLETLVDILDSARVPLNATERKERVEGKAAHALFPYYGATGQVGEIDGYLFDEPLILLGEDGVPFLDQLRRKAYLVQGKCWVNNHAHVLRARDAAVDRRYLAGFLNIFDYNGFVTGSTRLKLTQAAMRSIPVSVAPLLEQKRIADKLDALLARVHACQGHLDRVPGILKRFRQSVLAAATSGKLTREWREARGLGMEWLASRIEDIAAVGTGSTPARSSSAFYSTSGTPWITSAATGLPFVTQSEEFVTDAAIAAHRLKRYPVGTLLVAMYGEGKTRGQVTELRIEATINQACAAISVDERKATRSFVRLALESNYLEMRELAEGGNQPNLNLSKIKDFPLLLPSLEEQRAVAERVDAILAWVAAVHMRVEAASELVQRLTPSGLAKAFRGELVPQDPDDESAADLLARIFSRRAAPGVQAKPKRGDALGPRTKAKSENDMLTRKDIKSSYLTTILRERGALTAEALWSISHLEIDEFYDQLKDEEAQGLLRENRGDSLSAPRLLEAVT